MAFRERRLPSAWGCLRIAAIERLESEDIIEVVSRYSDDGGQLANGICLTERGEWYLEGIRAGMLVQDLIKDEVADR